MTSQTLFYPNQKIDNAADTAVRPETQLLTGTQSLASNVVIACSTMRPRNALDALSSDVKLPTPAGGGGLCLCRWQALESRSHESGLIRLPARVFLADVDVSAPTRWALGVYPTYSEHTITFSLSRCEHFCETFSRSRFARHQLSKQSISPAFTR